MSRTDRIEQARRHLTSLMAARDSVAAANPVDLNHLRYLDAAIDAEIADAVAAYEDVLAPTSSPTPVPLPPPPQWDHSVRIHAAQRSPLPDVSYLEHRVERRRVLLACIVLVAFLVTGVLLFTFWPTATTLEPTPADDQVAEEQSPAPQDGVAPVERSVVPAPVPTVAPSVAPAQLAAAPAPDQPPLVVEAVTAPERDVHPSEPAAKAKKSKRKRRKRKRRRKRKDRKIKMGNSRDPLSGL